MHKVLVIVVMLGIALGSSRPLGTLFARVLQQDSGFNRVVELALTPDLAKGNSDERKWRLNFVDRNTSTAYSIDMGVAAPVGGRHAYWFQIVLSEGEMDRSGAYVFGYVLSIAELCLGLEESNNVMPWLLNRIAVLDNNFNRRYENTFGVVQVQIGREVGVWYAIIKRLDRPGPTWQNTCSLR